MQEWPFNAELGQAAQQDAHSGLEPIPEEASDRPPKMSSVAGCLLFVLGMESAGSSIKDAIPTGQCLILLTTTLRSQHIRALSSQISWLQR